MDPVLSGGLMRKGCSGRDLNPYALGALEPESSVSAIPPPEPKVGRLSKSDQTEVSRTGLAQLFNQVGTIEFLAKFKAHRR